MTESVAAEGIDRLISRLRDDGVKAGEQQSAEIVRKAEEKAARILANAQKAANEATVKAQEEISTLDLAAKGALRMAARDTMLHLRNEVRKAFERYMRQMVVQSTADPDFVRSLILILAGEASEKHIQDKEAHIHLSRAVLERESNTESRRQSSQFVKAIATGLLRKGITLVPSDDVSGGARVRLVDDQIEIDLTDQMITDLLVRHLTPRFREIMSGSE